VVAVAVAGTVVQAQAQVVLAVAVAVVLMVFLVVQVAVLRLITAQTARLLAVNPAALVGRTLAVAAVRHLGVTTRLVHVLAALASLLFAIQFKENLNGTFCKSC
jgi:hypothetical protein